MTPDEVDAFFNLRSKRLPAAFGWEDKSSRKNERRSRQRIEANGRLSSIEFEATIRMFDPGYLIVVLLAPTCIARLCLGLGHVDRRTRERVECAHYHSWEGNRPKGKALPKALFNYEIPLPELTDRNDALTWFFQRTGIESRNPEWPDSAGLV